MIEFLITLVVVLLVVGVLFWGAAQFPIDPTFLRMGRAVVVVVLAIWVILAVAEVLGHPVVHVVPFHVRR